jgi:hypothetical protein
MGPNRTAGDHEVGSGRIVGGGVVRLARPPTWSGAVGRKLHVADEVGTGFCSLDCPGHRAAAMGAGRYSASSRARVLPRD